MLSRKLMTTVSLAGLLVGLTAVGASAQTALTGKIASAEEATMEGVLVSAKKAGSTITTTVVSHADGAYQLPGRSAFARPLRHHHPCGGLRSRRAERGRYRGRDARDRRSQAHQDQEDPGAALQRRMDHERARAAISVKSFLPDCVGCHTLQRVFSALHTPEEWKNVFVRMGRYAPSPCRPVRSFFCRAAPAANVRACPANMMDAAADFWSTANVNNPDNEGLTFKRLPRPKGRVDQCHHHRIRSAAQRSVAA